MRHRELNRCLKFFAFMGAAALLFGLSGCAMCCAPYDCDYGYQGGAWVRDNPSWGRVGSVIEPAGYKAVEDRRNPDDGEPTPAAESSDDAAPMPESDNFEPERMEPMPEAGPGTISTPRLRAVRNYLPEN